MLGLIPLTQLSNTKIGAWAILKILIFFYNQPCPPKTIEKIKIYKLNEEKFTCKVQKSMTNKYYRVFKYLLLLFSCPYLCLSVIINYEEL